MVLRAGGAAAARRGAGGPAAAGAGIAPLPVSGTGRPLTSGHLAGCRGPCRTDSPATASRTVFMLSSPTARSSPAGAGISRCLRLREPVRFVWQQISLVVCSQPLPRPRAGPGLGKGKGWRGTETAVIQQLRNKSGAVAAKAAVRERKGEKHDRRDRKSGAANRAVSGAWPRPVPRTALDRAAGGSPASRPGAGLFVLPQRAVMPARVPGLLKRQRNLFLQDCSQATRPSNFGAA